MRKRNVTIEAGKFYADGHGRKRGPMERHRDWVPEVWGEPGSADLWMTDGEPFNAPSSMHPEITSEWVDASAQN